MKRYLYTVIWQAGHQEDFWVDNLKELLQYIDEYSSRLGKQLELVFWKK